MSRKPSRSVRARRQEMQARKKRQRLVTALIVPATLAASAVIIFVARDVNRVGPQDVALPELLIPPNADGTAWGPADAPVVVEEYSDFQ